MTRSLASAAAVLQSIGLLLSEPNPDDGLMTDIVRGGARVRWRSAGKR